MNNELDAVRALPAKWLADMPTRDAQFGDRGASGEAVAYERCIDELEAALSTQPAPSAPVVYAPFRDARGRMAGIRSVIANLEKGDDHSLDTALGTLHELVAVLSTPSEQVAASVAAPEGWRDIATAPRDGTEILAWSDHEGRYVTEWCAFKDGFGKSFEGFPHPDAGELGPTLCDATHWHPLAAAPVAPEREG